MYIALVIIILASITTIFFLPTIQKKLFFKTNTLTSLTKNSTINNTKKVDTDPTPIPNETKNVNPVMSKAERIKLNVKPSLKVEVLRRDEKGSPTDYRVLK